MRKYYAGPRISARRIAGIMNGEEVPEGRKKSPNETASKTRKARVAKDLNTATPAEVKKKIVESLSDLGKVTVSNTTTKTIGTGTDRPSKQTTYKVKVGTRVVGIRTNSAKPGKFTFGDLVGKGVLSTPMNSAGTDAAYYSLGSLKRRIGEHLGSGKKSSSPVTKNTGKSSRLDNPSQNKGQSYNEWKASVTKAYGRGVKFVSYDVPSSGVSAELKGKLVDYYSLDLDANQSAGNDTAISNLSGPYVDFYEDSHRKAVTSALTSSLKDAKLSSKAKITETGATLDVRIRDKKEEVVDRVFSTILAQLKAIGKEKKASFTYKVQRSNGKISGMKIYANETKAARSSVKRA